MIVAVEVEGEEVPVSAEDDEANRFHAARARVSGD